MNRIIIAFFLISVFLVSLLPVKDTDFGWHYRCGQQFLATGKLCLTNEFSYFLPNYRAYNPSFLYDITLAFIYNHSGFVGVSFLGAVVLTLCAFFIFQFFPGPSWLKILDLYALFWLSYSTFGLGLRSQIISYMFFVITLFILNKSKNNIRWLYLLPLIFLIWANTHVGFFLGPILLGFFIIDFVSDKIVNRPQETLPTKPSHDRWRGWKGSHKRAVFYEHLWEGNPRQNLSWLLIFFLSILASFLNPFGPKVYLEIIHHFQAPLNTMIAEWVAPNLWQQGLIITLIIATISLMLKDRSFSLSSLLMLGFFGISAFTARRSLPLFYTVFFYIILNLKSTSKLFVCFDNGRVKNTSTNQLVVSLLVSLAFFFAVINIPQTVNFHQSWENYCHQGLIGYPCQAVEKTNLKQLSGNLFTAYEWGGFLIWQTPKLKVFVDGRMSAWKDENGQYPYQVYLYIIQAQPGWNEKLKKQKTDYLLIGNGTFLDLELQKHAAKYGWKESYRDNITVFYKKI